MKKFEESQDGLLSFSLDNALARLADILHQLGVEEYSMTENSLNFIISEEHANEEQTQAFSKKLIELQMQFGTKEERDDIVPGE